MDEERREFEDDAEEEDDLGPGSADYDLSEEHGYTWEPERESGGIPQWLMVAVTALVVAALVLPTIILIYRYG